MAWRKVGWKLFVGCEVDDEDGKSDAFLSDVNGCLHPWHVGVRACVRALVVARPEPTELGA